YSVRAPRFELRVDEDRVAELALGVVVDVLRHVFVELLQRFGIGRTPAAAGDLAVLDAPELVVLLPQIRLEDLGGREEPEDGCVAGGQRRGGRLGERGRGATERAKAG